MDIGGPKENTDCDWLACVRESHDRHRLCGQQAPSSKFDHMGSLSLKIPRLVWCCIAEQNKMQNWRRIKEYKVWAKPYFGTRIVCGKRRQKDTQKRDRRRTKDNCSSTTVKETREGSLVVQAVRRTPYTYQKKTPKIRRRDGDGTLQTCMLMLVCGEYALSPQVQVTEMCMSGYCTGLLLSKAAVELSELSSSSFE